jgi:hypothetical protein
MSSFVMMSLSGSARTISKSLLSVEAFAAGFDKKALASSTKRRKIIQFEPFYLMNLSDKITT